MITVTLKPGQRRTAPLPDKKDYMLVNWRINSNPHAWRPPTDVYERDDRLEVRVEIAGMNENDFMISIDQNILLVRGNRPDNAERRAYHQMEINFGEFMTVVEFHIPVDLEHVHADYQNGLLWIILPKAQPKVIKIKENE